MKPSIDLSIDRTTVTEGEVVEIFWNCSNCSAPNVTLTIDNGYKATDIVMPPQGSRKFRLNRAKWRVTLKLTVSDGGKSYRKSLHVRVKALKAVRPKVVDSKGRSMGSLRLQMERLRQRWSDQARRTRYEMSALDGRKQTALRTLGLVVVTAILTAISPKLTGLGLFLLGGYLVLVLMKK